MIDCFISLGSNLGDSVVILKEALLALKKIEKSVFIQHSSFYQSAPIDCPTAQNDFVNAAAHCKTELSPFLFLKALHAIENAFGRKRPFLNAPRTLDLDLLLYGDIVAHSPDLTLPHPRMHLRSFVLTPLCEIAPHLAIPQRGTANAWRVALSLQKIFRL